MGGEGNVALHDTSASRNGQAAAMRLWQRGCRRSDCCICWRLLLAGGSFVCGVIQCNAKLTKASAYALCLAAQLTVSSRAACSNGACAAGDGAVSHGRGEAHGVLCEAIQSAIDLGAEVLLAGGQGILKNGIGISRGRRGASLIGVDMDLALG